MYGLSNYFGDPQTITLTVAFLSSAITYAITQVNYKQISYLARAAMLLTVIVIVYTTLTVLYKAYSQYLYSPIESIVV